MKKILFILFLTSILNTVYSQEQSPKEKIVLIYNNQNNISLEENILFKIEDENYRYIKDLHKKEYVLIKDIFNNIINTKDLKIRTLKKLKNENIKDIFIQSYYDKYYDIFIYVKNKKCENEGVLYESEWILSITKPEVN